MTDLIKNAMETIAFLANQYLRHVDQRDDEWVILTSIVDHSGSLNTAARDKIVMSIYNITREVTISSFQPVARDQGNTPLAEGLAVTSPPLYVDVHLMFMANFTEKKYVDGLAALSRLIAYFQQTPCISPVSAPMLDPVFDKLTLDFENLSPVDVNYVMSMLGTRYLPSAFYKVRMIPFVSSAMQSRTYAIAGAGTPGSVG